MQHSNTLVFPLWIRIRAHYSVWEFRLLGNFFQQSLGSCLARTTCTAWFLRFKVLHHTQLVVQASLSKQTHPLCNPPPLRGRKKNVKMRKNL